MADILTHLRELSFGYGILSYKSTNFIETPKSFLNFCKKNINNCESLQIAQIAKNKDFFNEEEKTTIYNGIELAKYVIQKNIIEIEDINVSWLGNETQSGKAWDIKINGIYFSLKENSFILHNMGLYQIINIITDRADYKRGLHVFEKFGLAELQYWFAITRDLMIQYLKKGTFQTKDKQGRTIKLAYSSSEDSLYLFFYDNEERIYNFSTCTYQRFLNDTTSKYREKVFSKFINQNLQKNETYLKYKKICAETAGKNLVDFLQKNIQNNPSPRSLFSLFRITDESYYYAKTTLDNIEVYKVPSKKNFHSKIKITDIKCSVPDSQLNLLTTIKNIDTHEELVVRNELRYSHGQFNGTPEAKMYIDTGSLLIAYDSI